jgi:hypothetical protein
MAISNKYSIAILCLSFFGLLTGCTKRGGGPADPYFLFGPEIQAANVQSNNCLNVGRLVNYISHPGFNYPGTVMTVDFHPLTDVTSSQMQFYAYSSFYKKNGMINKMGLFTRADQDDSCSTVQLEAASGEKLVYDITDHSPTQITFRLNTKEMNSDLADHLRDSFKNRKQPYEYTVTYLSPTQIKIAEKYHAPDAVCGNKRSVDFEVVKMVSWSRDDSGLPGSYEINPNYISSVKSALQNQPALSSENVLSLADISSVMSTPLRDELKMCM